MDDGSFAGTVHDYMLVTGANPSTAVNDITRSELLQSTTAQSVFQETLLASASLTPPPRPPPPRVSPHRREHQSLVPPALPPKERHGGVSLTVDETTEKISARMSSRLVPPPLPQPRQKCKETSPVGCSRSAIADRLASKVVPPLPVDDSVTRCKADLVSSPSPVQECRNMTVPKCDRHAITHQLQLGIDTPAVGLKGGTIPRATSDCHWPLDAVASCTKGPLSLPLDRASSTECSVCLERPIDCVLYTCGHMCMCYECAAGVHHASIEGGSCPICRQTIKDVIKIYRS